MMKENVGVLIIDNPPVNALNSAIRSSLIAAIDKCSRELNATAIVVIGADDTFIAGSDVNEFFETIPPPLLPDVITAIELFAGPVVAAIDGHALGGGLELALGCDARVATTGAVLGFPEVSLGIIPGAGGTQRLPRLTGARAAAELIVSSRSFGTDEAHRLGVVDLVVERDGLLGAAVDLASSLPGKSRIPKVGADPALGDDFITYRDGILSGPVASRSVVEALALVEKAFTMPVREALQLERSTFDELRQSPDAAALRYLFFAERRASRFAVTSLHGSIQNVGVIGAGRMGAGIAQQFVEHGFSTTLVDSDQAVLKRSLPGHPHVMKSTDLNAVANADLIIEAIVEDIDAKSALLARLGSISRAEAIVASNTSYLDIDDLAGLFARPRDFLGLHFFNPPHRMALVEVIRGEQTRAAVLGSVLETVKRIGKKPVIVNGGVGFIGNRMYAAYRRQCEFLLREGALPEQVDRVLTRFGFAMGPFAVADLSGLDIAWSMRKRAAVTRDARERYVDIPDRLCEIGRLGTRAQRGYYQYAEGSRTALPDPEVRAIIEDSSLRAGVERRHIMDREIELRALCALVNEAALIVQEGIARHPSDVDVVATLGFGFPRRLGGPLWWANQQPESDITLGLDLIEHHTGFGFVRGAVAELLATVSATA